MGRQRSYDSADELSGGRFGNDIERQEIEQRRHKMNSVKAKQDALRRRQHDAAVKKKQLQAVERGMKGGYQKMESPSVFVGTGLVPTLPCILDVGEEAEPRPQEGRTLSKFLRRPKRRSTEDSLCDFFSNRSMRVGTVNSIVPDSITQAAPQPDDLAYEDSPEKESVPPRKERPPPQLNNNPEKKGSRKVTTGSMLQATLQQHRSNAKQSTGPTTPRRKTDDVDMIISVARKAKMTVAEVKAELANFNSIKARPDVSYIDGEVFLAEARRRFQLREDAFLPRHLLTGSECIAAGCGMSFVAFMDWWCHHRHAPELLGEATEWELRKLAAKLGVDMFMMEHLKETFDSFDEDKSGVIDKDEFKAVVRQIMGATEGSDVPADLLQRLWRECDKNGDGQISLTRRALAGSVFCPLMCSPCWKGQLSYCSVT